MSDYDLESAEYWADQHDALHIKYQSLLMENAALTAQLAAIEGELEAACVDHCIRCFAGNIPTRTLGSTWRHQPYDQECEAWTIRERQFQRRLGQSGE